MNVEEGQQPWSCPYIREDGTTSEGTLRIS
jgi:hypothetical protein